MVPLVFFLGGKYFPLAIYIADSQLLYRHVGRSRLVILASFSLESADPDSFSLSAIGQHRVDATKRDLCKITEGQRKKYAQMKNSEMRKP